MVICMNIIKITPQGFCGGVKNAIKIINEAINDPNTIKPIYLLGMLIHNHYVCEALEKKGVIILKDKPYEKIIDEINCGTIVISAHGVSLNLKNKILNKNLKLIDTTCPIVNNIHINIFKYLNMDYEILYIGKNNHPETIGVLGESNKIHLIENINDFLTLNKEKKYYLTNQTTLASSYLNEFHNYAKEYFKNIIIENSTCISTTKREELLYNVSCDLLIVVGDPKSSNTKNLYIIAKEKSLAKEVIFIESAKDLINYDFSHIDLIYITSGASTPSAIVDQVIKYLNTNDKSILNEELIVI